MSQFTYESQGVETVLVTCQLEEQEHIDSFSERNASRSNDIAGLVIPSYSRET